MGNRFQFSLAVLFLSHICFASPSATRQSIANDLKKQGGASFEVLIQKWEKNHGTSAIQPLLEIGHDSRHFESEQRYVALMAIAKMGGQGSAKWIMPFLKDSNWMMRCGALRSLTALGNPVAAQAVAPLLHDPALVVRAEAVTAVEALRPEGASKLLALAARDPSNYRQGKAEWVPQRALKALVRLRAGGASRELAPLLDRGSDPELQLLTVETLEAITGKSLVRGRPFSERLRAWKRELSQG